MARKRKQKTPMPEIDVTKLGRKFRVEFGETLVSVNKYLKIIDRLEPEDSSQDAIQEFEEAYDKYMAKMREIGIVQAQMIGSIIISVPLECLMSDTPAKIDWSHPDSFDWMLPHVYDAIVAGIRDNSLLSGNSKN